jgi:glutathione S-transferase
MPSGPLIVYGSWEAFGLPDFSPFCLKLKTYLRMAGIPYESRSGDPRKGPKGKIPYIVDGDTRMGDSQLIIEYLQKKHGNPLDDKLTPADHAVGHLVRRTLEEAGYWSGLHARWLDDANWEPMAKAFAPVLPKVIGPLLMKTVIRGATRKRALAQGIARHDPATISAMASADVDALAVVLGDKDFLLGAEPSSYDAVVYGFLANLLAFPPDGAIARRAKTHENLLRYVERMKARYWATGD